jgi:hypothetical protein
MIYQFHNLRKTESSSLYILIILIILMSLSIPISSADYWSSSVHTNGTSWSIERQSENVSFTQTGIVEGKVSEIGITPVGRKVEGYYSQYANYKANDVGMSERTSARKGDISYVEGTVLEATDYGTITEDLVKPADSPYYSIDYTETWPVIFGSYRQIRYTGSNIDRRDLAKNNQDYAGTSLLYNKELSEETRSFLVLQRMNASVIATDEDIVQAEFMPTKSLQYSTMIHTTGIADLNYRLTGPEYDPKHRNYPAVAEGHERYSGTYDISRNINMRSIFIEGDIVNYDWLPCSCSEGFLEIPNSYGKGYDSESIFNQI